MEGHLIAKARIDKGLSQKDLAEKVGTSQQQICRYENSQRDCKAEMLIKLSNALGVSISYLLGTETLEEAARRLMKEKCGSVAKFAKEIDTPVTSIYSALDRGFANTRTELTDKIYRALEIDWETTRLDGGYANLELKGGSRVFCDASAMAYNCNEAASQPIPFEMHKKFPDAFLMKVEDDSLDRILPNGSYALVDPDQTEPVNGKPYAVRIGENTTTIKRVKKLNNGFELAPDSTDPTYVPTVYDYNKQGTDPVTIIGRVVYYVLPFDWEF